MSDSLDGVPRCSKRLLIKDKIFDREYGYNIIAITGLVVKYSPHTRGALKRPREENRTGDVKLGDQRLDGTSVSLR